MVISNLSVRWWSSWWLSTVVMMIDDVHPLFRSHAPVRAYATTVTCTSYFNRRQKLRYGRKAWTFAHQLRSDLCPPYTVRLNPRKLPPSSQLLRRIPPLPHIPCSNDSAHSACRSSPSTHHFLTTLLGGLTDVTTGITGSACSSGENLL